MNKVLKFRNKTIYHFCDRTKAKVDRDKLMLEVYHEHYGDEDFMAYKGVVIDSWNCLEESRRSDWANEYDERQLRNYSLLNPEKFKRMTDPEEYYFYNQKMERLNKALETFSDELVELFEDVVLYEKTFAEIAKERNVSIQAIHQQYWRMVKTLQKKF